MEAATPSEGFSALGLDPTLLDALTALGYEEPTPIQREAIPALLGGRDVLGQAATGTGKTAAFSLPLLQAVARTRQGASGAEAGGARGPLGLVLVPTRELAMQVAQAMHRYGRGLGVSIVPIYGGQPMPQQLRALARGADIVVATPGRALDHVRRGTLALGHVGALVLDEADEMLDMGFAEDLEAILSETPPTRQTALLSATMPPRIRQIAGRHLRDPVQVKIAKERPEEGAPPQVRQVAYVVPRAHKLAALLRVLDMEAPPAALIFCRTRTEVDEISAALAGRGYRAEALHGGMSQAERDRVMGQFRGGAAELLVATDVAARGLDIEHLSHVVNYDVPFEPEAYVHRIGRTGRAGRSGVAITFAEPREGRLLRNIERAAGQPLELATVPSVAALQAKRLEVAGAQLREAILGGELDRYRAAVEALAEEFELPDIAAAALKLSAAARGEEDEREIPQSVPREYRRPEGPDGRAGRYEGRAEGRRPWQERGEGRQEARRPWQERGEQGEGRRPWQERGEQRPRPWQERGEPGEGRQEARRPWQERAEPGEGRQEARRPWQERAPQDEGPRPGHGASEERPHRAPHEDRPRHEHRAHEERAPFEGHARPAHRPHEDRPRFDERPRQGRPEGQGERPHRTPRFAGPEGPGERPGRPWRGGFGAGEAPPARQRRGRDEVPETVRLFIGAGRRAGVRPQDLVGAIANEAGLSGRAVGAIDIADGFSLVEVPAAYAEDITQALRRTRIKGHRVIVRRDLEDEPARPRA